MTTGVYALNTYPGGIAPAILENPNDIMDPEFAGVIGYAHLMA